MIVLGRFFKAAIYTVLAVMLLYFLSSCAPGRDYLGYQSYPVTFEAELNVDGGGNSDGSGVDNSISADISLTMTGYCEGAVIFNSPASLSGVRFDVGNDVSVSYGELGIPVAYGSESLIMQLFRMLSLKPEELVAVSVTECNGVAINIAEYKTDRGSVYVYLNTEKEKSNPVRISADYCGTAVVLNINRVV